MRPGVTKDFAHVVLKVDFVHVHGGSRICAQATCAQTATTVQGIWEIAVSDPEFLNTVGTGN